MKIFEWITSLFKKEITEQVPVKVNEFKVTAEPKTEVTTPSFTTTEEIKSKKRKRGRPRKKKVEQK